MTDLALTWLDTPQAMAALNDEWLDLADRVGADVFMQPDWQAVWWRHFSHRRSLACLVARQNGTLVGVLPFAIERIWLGPVPVKIARLSGTDPNCIIFRLAVEPALAAAVLSAAIRHLTGALGCLAVSFTPLSEMAAHTPALRSLTDLGPTDNEAGGHIVFELPDTFEAYLATLGKGRREQFKRNTRALTKTFEMVKDRVVPDLAQFDEFVDLHGAQWRAQGKGGHFVDWPGSADFFRDLAVTTAARERLQFDRLTGNIGVLAMEMSMVASGTAHWRIPARKFDPEVHRQSAGTVVFVAMFERMIRENIRLIEAGRGEYGYKLEFGGKPVKVRQMLFCRPGGLARLQLRALLLWADFLNFAYYRVWFLKIAPRLRKATGLRPRPLWRSWISTRL